MKSRTDMGYLRIRRLGRAATIFLLFLLVAMQLRFCGFALAEQAGRLDIHVRQVFNADMDDSVLDAPYAVEIDRDGDIFIADTANNRIVKYIGGDFSKPIYYPPQNPEAEPDEGTGDVTVNTSVSGDGTTDIKVLSNSQTQSDRKLFKPMAVAFYEDLVYVADTGNGRIVVLRDEGDRLAFMSAYGYFIYMGVLRDIKCDAVGICYMLDSRYGRILKYDWQGNRLPFKDGMAEISGLKNPYGLTIGADGSVFVADTTNHRVKKYAPNGDLLLEFGEKGKGEGKLFFPQDVAIDNEGSIFVADTENNRMMKFLPDGSYVGWFGEWGRGEGEFFHSRKMSFGIKDNLLLMYAVDTSLWRVQIIEVTPFINIIHEPLKYIAANPFLMGADVEKLIDEDLLVKMKYKINEGEWSFAELAPGVLPRFESNVTIPGLMTGQLLTYRIEAAAVSGSTNNFTEYFEIPVDLTPPVIFNTKPEEFSYYNTQTFELSAEYYDQGMGVATESVTLARGTTALTLQELTPNGMKYTGAAAELSENNYEYKLTVGDRAEHESTYTWHVVVDRTLPQASISGLRPLDFADIGLQRNSGGVAIAAGRMEISGTVSDANIDYFTIETGIGAAPAIWTETGRVDATGNMNGPLYIWDSTQHQDGDMTLRLTAVDKAGNRSAPALTRVIVDNTRPQAAITQPYFSEVIQPLSLLGGNTQVKGTINDVHLRYYKLESAMLYLSDLQTQCGTAGGSSGQTIWTTLAQQNYATLYQANPLDLNANWTVSGIEPDATEIYTLRLTVRDAYHSYSYCSMFNVGLEGIVITPIPTQNMPTNKLSYDLSDAGSIIIQIFRVKKESKITSADDFRPGVADFTKFLVANVDQPRGLNEVVWDGTNSAGNKMPDTSATYVYYYLITATNDGGVKTKAYGQITKQNLPEFTSYNMNSSSSDISFIINKLPSTLRIEIYNAAGNLVNAFDAAQYIGGPPAYSGYVYYLGWGGINKYGKQIDYGPYTVKLKAVDSAGNTATKEFTAYTGYKKPTITATSPTKKRTDPVRLSPGLPYYYDFYAPGTKIATASKRSATATEITDLSNLAAPGGIAAAKVLSVTKYHEIAVNSTTDTIPFLWNGVTTNPTNTNEKTQHGLGQYEFYIFNANNERIGYNTSALAADTTLPYWSSTQDTSAADFNVTLWGNEYVKNYVISVYDGDGNLMDIQSVTGNEDTWSGTGYLPIRNWKTTRQQINWTSAGRFPRLYSNTLSFVIQSEDVAGNVNTSSFDVQKNGVPFTEDTGAIIISNDKNGMLRIPPYSVSSGQAYNTFNIIERNSSEFPPLPSGVVFLDKIYNFQPDGATFLSAKPAALRLYYKVDSQGYVLKDGIRQGHETKLAFYYFNVAENTWERIAGAVGVENYGLVTERHYIWAPLYHLSNYCLGMEKDSVKPVAKVTAPSGTVLSQSTYTIEGTASDANIAGYTLSYGKLDQGNSKPPTAWITFASGTTSITNGTLGIWNLTHLEGNYRLKLTVWDNSENYTTFQKDFKTQGGAQPSIGLTEVSLDPSYIAPAGTPGSYKRITLSYKTAEEGYATIHVVDTAGSIIKTLALDEFIMPGQHTLYFYGDTNDGSIADDGRVNFKLILFDRDKNRTEQTTRNFFIDSTSPVFSEMTPAQDVMVLDDRPVISVRIADGTGSGLRVPTLNVLFNGTSVSAYTFTGGLLSFTAPTDTQNSNTVVVTIRDLAGNTGTAQWSFRGDRTPPAILSLTENYSPFSPSDSMDRKDVWAITATVEEPHGFDWMLQIDSTSGDAIRNYQGSFDPMETGGPFTIQEKWYGNKTWTNEYNEIEATVMPDGEYSYTLRLTDSKGNETVREGLIEKDDTLPAISSFIQDFAFFSPFESPLMMDTLTFTASVIEKNPEKITWLIQDKNDREVYRQEIILDGEPITDKPLRFEWNGLINGITRAPDNYYGIALIVYDEAGNFAMKSGVVGLDNTKPVANPGADIAVPQNSEVLFDATGSTDNLTGIASYQWDLDGNGTFETTGATTTRYFDQVGIFTVSLKVTDNAGNSDVKARRVSVDNVAPVVEAGPDMAVQYGDTLTFTGTYSDPGDTEAHQAAWDFGDGTPPAPALLAEHRYLTASGIYNAVLTVTDSHQGIGQDSLTITVEKEDTAIAYTGAIMGHEGETVLVRAQLSETDDEVGDLSNKQIIWTIGDLSVSAQTDSVGYAESLLPLTLAPGNYSLTARFDGDAFYLASQDVSSITVEQGSADLCVSMLGGGMGVIEPVTGGMPLSATFVPGVGTYGDTFDNNTYEDNWSLGYTQGTWSLQENNGKLEMGLEPGATVDIDKKQAYSYNNHFDVALDVKFPSTQNPPTGDIKGRFALHIEARKTTGEWILFTLEWLIGNPEGKSTITLVEEGGAGCSAEYNGIALDTVYRLEMDYDPTGEARMGIRVNSATVLSCGVASIPDSDLMIHVGGENYNSLGKVNIELDNFYTSIPIPDGYNISAPALSLNGMPYDLLGNGGGLVLTPCNEFTSLPITENECVTGAKDITAILVTLNDLQMKDGGGPMPTVLATIYSTGQPGTPDNDQMETAITFFEDLKQRGIISNYTIDAAATVLHGGGQGNDYTPADMPIFIPIDEMPLLSVASGLNHSARFKVTDCGAELFGPESLDVITLSFTDMTAPAGIVAPAQIDIQDALSAGAASFDANTGEYTYEWSVPCSDGDISEGDAIQIMASAEKSFYASGPVVQATDSVSVVLDAVDMAMTSEPAAPGPLHAGAGESATVTVDVSFNGAKLSQIPVEFRISSVSPSYMDSSILPDMIFTDANGRASAVFQAGSYAGGAVVSAQSVCAQQSTISFNVETQSICQRPACPVIPQRPASSNNCNPPATGKWTVTDSDIVCVYDPANPSLNLSNVDVSVEGSGILTLLGFPVIKSILASGNTHITIFDSTITGDVELRNDAVGLLDGVSLASDGINIYNNLILRNNSIMNFENSELNQYAGVWPTDNSQMCMNNSYVFDSSRGSWNINGNAIVYIENTEMDVFDAYYGIGENSIVTFKNVQLDNLANYILPHQNAKTCIIDSPFISNLYIRDGKQSIGGVDVEVRNSNILNIRQELLGTSLALNDFNQNPGQPFSYEYQTVLPNGSGGSRVNIINSTVGTSDKGGLGFTINGNGVFEDQGSRIQYFAGYDNTRLTFDNTVFYGDINGTWLVDNSEATLNNVTMLHTAPYAAPLRFMNNSKSDFNNLSCGYQNSNDGIAFFVYDNHTLTMSNSTFDCMMYLLGSDVENSEVLIDLSNNPLIYALRYYSYYPGPNGEYANSRATVYAANTQFGRDNPFWWDWMNGLGFEQFGKSEFITQEYNASALPDVDYVPTVRTTGLVTAQKTEPNAAIIKGPMLVNTSHDWWHFDGKPFKRVFPTYVHSSDGAPLSNERVCLVEDKSNPICIAGTETYTDADGQAEPFIVLDYNTRNNRYFVCAPDKGECDYHNITDGVGFQYVEPVAIDPADTAKGPIAIAEPAQGDIVVEPDPVITGESEFTGQTVEIYLSSSQSEIPAETPLSPEPPRPVQGFDVPALQKSRIIREKGKKPESVFSISAPPMHFQGADYHGENGHALFVDFHGKGLLITSPLTELIERENGATNPLFILSSAPVNLALISRNGGTINETLYSQMNLGAVRSWLSANYSEDVELIYYQDNILEFVDGAYQYAPVLMEAMPFADPDNYVTQSNGNVGFAAYSLPMNNEIPEPDEFNHVNETAVYVAASAVQFSSVAAAAIDSDSVLIATGTITNQGTFEAQAVDIGEEGEKSIYAVVEDRHGHRHRSPDRKFKFTRSLKEPYVFNYPEPFIALQGTTIVAAVKDQVDSLEVEIKDVRGVTVRKLTPVWDGRLYTVWWNGKDESAQFVDTGTYYVTVKMRLGNKTIEKSLAVEVEGGGR